MRFARFAGGVVLLAALALPSGCKSLVQAQGDAKTLVGSLHEQRELSGRNGILIAADFYLELS